MSDFAPLQDDVLLKGLLVVRVIGRRDARPRSGQRVAVQACGYY